MGGGGGGGGLRRLSTVLALKLLPVSVFVSQIVADFFCYVLDAAPTFPSIYSCPDTFTVYLDSWHS
jgi:hypothetical protein